MSIALTSLQAVEQQGRAAREDEIAAEVKQARAGQVADGSSAAVLRLEAVRASDQLADQLGGRQMGWVKLQDEG